MNINSPFPPEPRIEIIPLQHPGNSHLSCNPDHFIGIEGTEPFAVEPDFRFFRIENVKNLFPVRFRVFHDLLSREGRPRLGLTRRISDHAGKISYEKNYLVTLLLKMFQFLDENRMPKVQIGSSGVKTCFYSQHSPGFFCSFEPLSQLSFLDHVDDTPQQPFQNITHPNTTSITFFVDPSYFAAHSCVVIELENHGAEKDWTRCNFKLHRHL